MTHSATDKGYYDAGVMLWLLIWTYRPASFGMIAPPFPAPYHKNSMTTLDLKLFV
jgi:hypothetical protein